MYKCWVLSESNIQVNLVVYWFTFYDQNIQGSCDNAFSEALSVFTSSQFYIDPLRSLVAEVRRSVNQKPGYDGS